jgi:phage terminase large subunit
MEIGDIMINTSLRDLIAPSFYELHNDIKHNRYTFYWLAGGRGSTKSSFVSIEIILNMMKYKDANTVILRKVKDTLRNSVYEQIKWSIEKLHVESYWRGTVSPLEFTYIPTGQKILFNGLDDPLKIKSMMVSKGYIKYAWFEEGTEFAGMEEIRNVLQSLLRGGENQVVFLSYNPPQSIRNWANQEITIDRADRKIHKSDYTTVPSHWLGTKFIIEAEHLKKVNEKAYNHEYLGEVTGTGGEIFKNVTIRTITNEEIAEFDQIRRAMDYGYSVDPFAYNTMHYDKKHKRLYIFFEINKVNLSNAAAVVLIKVENINNREIIADSAEPKSIDEMIDLGLRVKKAKKGPDSVEYGIKFLQDLEEIIVDNDRCPNTAREFLNYELEKDHNGNFKAKFPDKNNHHLDAIRYALSEDMPLEMKAKGTYDWYAKQAIEMKIKLEEEKRKGKLPM